MPSTKEYTLSEIHQGMAERGIRVVAHIVVAGQHHYDVTARRLEATLGSHKAQVLKWDRVEIRHDQRSTSNKNRLYKIAK